jgi:hypothetical protein
MLVGGPSGFFANQFLFPFAANFNFPRLKRFIVEQIPSQRVRDLIQVVDTMHHTSLEIIRAKQEALESHQPEVRAEMANKKDIISILSKWSSFSLQITRSSAPPLSASERNGI